MKNESMLAKSALLVLIGVLALATNSPAQPVVNPSVDKTVTVTGKASGTGLTAQDEAVSDALRKAVEQACGTFLTSQSKSQDYKLVYDKVFADTVGFVREHKVNRVWVQEGITNAEVTAHVSTQKFEQDWAVIAHTVNQENNPRVIIAITDADTDAADTEGTLLAGVVQSRLEDFFLSKGLQLMDKGTASDVNKRDIVLAGLKDDVQELAALGARFKADVVVYGQASSKQAGSMQVAGQTMYKYAATLNVRVVRTDSAQLMVSKAFGPVSVNSVQRGGHEKAMAQLADDSAPEVLKAVVEAWRKQVNVTRNIRLEISGMTYESWKTFRDEAMKLHGMKALRLREITEGVANIDVEYEFDTQNLADRIGEMKQVKLSVVEFNANRLKLKISDVKATADAQPMSSPSPSCDIDIRVRYAEVDQMGALHHSRFWVYFEMGRTELLRQQGVAYSDCEREGVFFVVAKCAASFKAPARYDDVLTLATRVVRMGAARIDHAYELKRKSDGLLIAIAETTLACVDRTGQIIAIPQSIRKD